MPSSPEDIVDAFETRRTTEKHIVRDRVVETVLLLIAAGFVLFYPRVIEHSDAGIVSFVVVLLLVREMERRHQLEDEIRRLKATIRSSPDATALIAATSQGDNPAGRMRDIRAVERG